MRLVEEQKYICFKRNGESNEEHSVLLTEHAMDIYTDGEMYKTVVCTEEWLCELVLGRLLCDGIIRALDDVKTLEVSEDHSVVDVELADYDVFETMSYEETVSYGRVDYPDEWIFAMADTMAAGMKLHEKTWATHSCFLYKQGELIFCCEDISRHNAVDKVIGYAVKNKIDLWQCAMYTSGRVPADMVDKVITAGISVLVSKGMPTFQAVELAKEAGITLVCGARRDQMRIYVDNRGK